ncbi:hypothetical protein HK098_001201 [Nowakowskiella sp. JEL0407]|nr:hypothetical protein HK098_001201 [Nowakowskiella sp. JEL0407]
MTILLLSNNRVESLQQEHGAKILYESQGNERIIDAGIDASNLPYILFNNSILYGTNLNSSLILPSPCYSARSSSLYTPLFYLSEKLGFTFLDVSSTKTFSVSCSSSNIPDRFALNLSEDYLAFSSSQSISGTSSLHLLSLNSLDFTQITKTPLPSLSTLKFWPSKKFSLAASSSDGYIRIFDLNHNKEVKIADSFIPPTTTSPTSSAAAPISFQFGKHYKDLIAIAGNSIFKLLDTKSSKIISQFSLLGEALSLEMSEYEIYISTVTQPTKQPNPGSTVSTYDLRMLKSSTPLFSLNSDVTVKKIAISECGWVVDFLTREKERGLKWIGLRSWVDLDGSEVFEGNGVGTVDKEYLDVFSPVKKKVSKVLPAMESNGNLKDGEVEKRDNGVSGVIQEAKTELSIANSPKISSVQELPQHQEDPPKPAPNKQQLLKEKLQQFQELKRSASLNASSSHSNTNSSTLNRRKSTTGVTKSIPASTSTLTTGSASTIPLQQKKRQSMMTTRSNPDLPIAKGHVDRKSFGGALINSSLQPSGSLKRKGSVDIRKMDKDEEYSSSTGKAENEAIKDESESSELRKHKSDHHIPQITPDATKMPSPTPPSTSVYETSEKGKRIQQANGIRQLSQPNDDLQQDLDVVWQQNASVKNIIRSGLHYDEEKIMTTVTKNVFGRFEVAENFEKERQQAMVKSETVMTGSNWATATESAEITPVLSSQNKQQQPPVDHVVLKNLIDESLETFREEMRRDIKNLHFEVVKEFYEQKVRLKYGIICMLY